MRNINLTDFDFSGKKVRYQGRVQDKFAVCYLLGMLEPEHSTYYTISAYDIKKYDELKGEFQEIVNKKLTH